MPMAYAGFAGEAELSQMIKDCRGEYVIASNNEELLISRYTPDIAGSLSARQNGRIFGKGEELRWETENGMIHFRYIGSDIKVPMDYPDQLDLSGCEERARFFYLWGQRSDTKNEWLDQRIPRILCYPVDTVIDRGRIVVEVVEYYDSKERRVKMSRYAGLKEVES